MKKYISFILAALFAIMLVSCGQTAEPDVVTPNDAHEFHAKVLEVNEQYLLVEPASDSLESQSSDKIKISLVHVSFPEKLEIGDFVQIEYDGIIQELYPAIIPNVHSVILVSSDQTAEPDESVADISTVLTSPGQSYIYGIEEGSFSAYVSGKVIEENKIGDKIEDVYVMGGWRDNSTGTWLSQEQLRGEVYAIRDISRDVAVALKFLDKGDALTTTHYYVIMNPDADLTAVEEYIIPTFYNNHGEE